jgi:hypothetical protein
MIMNRRFRGVAIAARKRVEKVLRHLPEKQNQTQFQMRIEWYQEAAVQVHGAAICALRMADGAILK